MTLGALLSGLVVCHGGLCVLKPGEISNFTNQCIIDVYVTSI